MFVGDINTNIPTTTPHTARLFKLCVCVQLWFECGDKAHAQFHKCCVWVCVGVCVCVLFVCVCVRELSNCCFIQFLLTSKWSSSEVYDVKAHNLASNCLGHI